MKTYTDLEKQALSDIRSRTDLLGDPKTEKEPCGHYHFFTSYDLSMKLSTAKGVMGSLEKKGVIEDAEHKGEGGIKVWCVRSEEIQEILGIEENGKDHTIINK